jgi:hypothetical protein
MWDLGFGDCGSKKSFICIRKDRSVNTTFLPKINAAFLRKITTAFLPKITPRSCGKAPVYKSA